MRKITVVSFLTMDGVLQGPGGPHEDTTKGFKWGGWQWAFSDEYTNQAIMKVMSAPFDLLLGRRTYEIFAAHWPYQNDEIAEKFNKINKYVVGTSTIDTSWNNTIQIKKDVVNELKKLKASEGPGLLLHGSSELIQTLLEHNLVDVLHTWTCPLILGEGKKLFKGGTPAQSWKLEESVVTTKGVFIATYVPAGEVILGSFVTGEPGEAELARRKKWKQEA